MEGVLGEDFIALVAINLLLLFQEEKLKFLDMQEGMDHLHLPGEMLIHQHIQEEGLALLREAVRLMIMNEEEGGAHRIMQGKGVLLLHLNLPQVMERILQASSGSSKSHHTNKSQRKHPAWKRSRKIKPKF